MVEGEGSTFCCEGAPLSRMMATALRFPLIVVVYFIAFNIVESNESFIRCPVGPISKHFPHDLDCTLFYVCRNGEAILKKCPKNLHFNRHVSVCDYPENADCKKGIVKEPETIPKVGANGQCPSQNPKHPVLLPHEDCTKFYICDSGIPLVKSCQKGLHFNAKLNVCDYPDKAGCDSGIIQPKGRESFKGLDPLCPLNEDGNPILKPHETDCRKFYTCNGGVTILQVCQNGLHFNAQEQKCDWPENAGCETKIIEKPDKIPKIGIDGQCPKEDSDTPVLLPHKDCTKFYMCHNGVLLVKSCQKGLHFNAKLNVCDYPDKAGCDSGFIKPKGRDGLEGLDTLCPLNEDGNPILKPHETDCRKFYTCNGGVSILQVCQNGLHFNAQLQKCDWPEKAGCETSIDKKPEIIPKITGNDGQCPKENSDTPVLLPHKDCSKFYMCNGGKPLVKSCQPGLHFNAKLNVCDYPDKAGCDSEIIEKPDKIPKIVVDGQCPKENSDTTVLLPHKDCTKFYICNDGKPLVKSCLSGLHFNAKLNVCDYPDKAGCDSGAIKPKGRDGLEGFDTLCPLNKDGNPVLKPHETDCRKFYACNGGVSILQVCQHGLHFNAQLQKCDWPENAGCETSAIKPKGRGGFEGLDTLCPLNEDGNPILKSHETDCRKFYTCNGGILILQVCQNGLHFNAQLQKCDWPENAGCETNVAVKPKGKSGKEVLNDICSQEDDGSLKPHETDCGKFYVCNGGQPQILKCQSGLHFNPKRQACDYPENVGCEKSFLKKLSSGTGDLNDFAEICASVLADKISYFPHPENCSMYYMCDSGILSLRQCPNDLHFNAARQLCDWPHEAQCERMGQLRSVGVPSAFCPPVNGKIPIFYRHPSNCSIYYMCSNGFSYEFACPSRLHFNLRRRLCDYEEVAMCSTGISGKKEEP
ncbi:hypothetical protein CDAR_581411 [Caerostris darwini]|uniref:Chitin-binding type-2 domain-containing protein n=1 Tax=Caerostris darwini TaxID=1538125 RepID=A0AAV4X856_9ARAC|nr:hypothetical protein CDAR_581411 [Caerostris darwini]